MTGRWHRTASTPSCRSSRPSSATRPIRRRRSRTRPIRSPRPGISTGLNTSPGGTRGSAPTTSICSAIHRARTPPAGSRPDSSSPTTSRRRPTPPIASRSSSPTRPSTGAPIEVWGDVRPAAYVSQQARHPRSRSSSAPTARRRSRPCGPCRSPIPTGTSTRSSPSRAAERSGSPGPIPTVRGSSAGSLDITAK